MTNNKKIYETVRMLRAHGMLREMNNKPLEKKLNKNIIIYLPSLYL